MQVQREKKENHTRLTTQAIRFAGEELSVHEDLGRCGTPGKIWGKMARRGPSGLEHPCCVRGRRGPLFRHPSGRGGLRRERRQARACPFLDGPFDRRKGTHRRRRKRQTEKRNPARDGRRQMDGLYCPFRAGGRQRPEADPHDGRQKGKILCAQWGKGMAHQWSPGRSLYRICRDR